MDPLEKKIYCIRICSIFCRASLFHHEWLALINISIRDGNSLENFILPGIEESRNDKFTFLEDRGIWNLFLRVLGKFQGMTYPKIPENPLKNSKKLRNKNQKKFQHWIYISTLGMFGIFDNNPKNWSVILKNRNENRKILTNFNFFIYI